MGVLLWVLFGVYDWYDEIEMTVMKLLMNAALKFRTTAHARVVTTSSQRFSVSFFSSAPLAPPSFLWAADAERCECMCVCVCVCVSLCEMLPSKIVPALLVFINC